LGSPLAIRRRAARRPAGRLTSCASSISGTRADARRRSRSRPHGRPGCGRCRTAVEHRQVRVVVAVHAAPWCSEWLSGRCTRKPSQRECARCMLEHREGRRQDDPGARLRAQPQHQRQAEAETARSRRTSPAGGPRSAVVCRCARRCDASGGTAATASARRASCGQAGNGKRRHVTGMTSRRSAPPAVPRPPRSKHMPGRSCSLHNSGSRTRA
jgi:hypothetical protein